MRHIIFILTILFLFTIPLFGQIPNSSLLYQYGLDFNHYSIEQSPLDNSYVIAGTQFNAGDTRIHVLKLDVNGVLQWEVTSNPGFDDRALDVMVDPNTADVVVAGYTDFLGVENIYVGKWDSFGGFIDDVVININHLGSGFPCAATSIMHSSITGNYIIGGFSADVFNYPLGSNNNAILFSLDSSLSGVSWVNRISSGIEAHSSINDLVETNTGRIFITGSVANNATGNPGYQGVLAMVVSPGSGIITNNLSFESTNADHVGVSASYDDIADEVWLMSNNSVIHNPQINVIRNVSNPGLATLDPTVSYYLDLDPTRGQTNAAGFTLLPHYDFPNDALVAVGYFRTANPDGSGNGDANLWYVEFERNTGSLINPAEQWANSSMNFHAHGGGLFSTFQGEHPYIFNQKIMTDNLNPGPSTSRYVALAPSDDPGVFGITVLPIPGTSSCVSEIDCDPILIGFTPITAQGVSSTVNTMTNLGISGMGQLQQEIDWCTIQPRSVDLDSKNDNLKEAIEILPNPTVNWANFRFNSSSSRTISIVDVKGVLIGEFEAKADSYKINARDWNPGIYIARIKNKDTGVISSHKIAVQ